MPPTICKCGLAKSYHEGRFNPGHDYEPRYEPVAWLEGYRAGVEERINRNIQYVADAEDGERPHPVGCTCHLE